MNRRQPLICFSIILSAVTLVGCGGADDYPNRPITLVCPWAAGGGTDRVSRQMAVHLEKVLGVPVNVINATGGKGVTGHGRGLHARPDGYTITTVTFELNTMHWSGLTGLTYEDCTPLMSINEDYAALFVRDDAPWQTLTELENEVKQNPGKRTASGTASGGAWHLALAGWLIASGVEATDVTWIPSAGANPSLQELMSGGVDMVCCSLPEARTLIESGNVRSLGVMSPKRAKGFEDVKTFPEQNNPWTLGGWRGLAVPKDTPLEVVEVLVSAIERIVDGAEETKIVTTENPQGITFPQFMEAQRFDYTSRGSAEFRQFLAENDEKLGKLLASDAMKSVLADRFSPMVFPNVLMGLIALTFVGLGVQRHFLISKREDVDPDLVPASTRRGKLNFAIMITAVIAFCLLGEVIGFVLMMGAILFAILCWLRTRLWVSSLIVIVFVPLVYTLFANVLRVPLPRGWLGW